MRVRAFMAEEGFARLRRQIAEIEGRPAGFEGNPFGDDPSFDPAIGRGPAAASAPPARPLLSPRRGGRTVAFGVPALDRLIRGGLSRHALHEVRGAETRDAGAAAGFAAAILARLAGDDARPVLWVTEEAAAREGGGLYGPGLGGFGLDPGRLVVVRAARAEEALWVFEEGLRCTGLAAVLAEIRGEPKALDLTASRRLALRARASGVMGLLLRQAGAAAPGAAATRWRVAPRPAGTLDDGFDAGIGRPAWHLDLERNRAGTTGSFDLEWDHGQRIFVPASVLPAVRPALPLAVAAVPRDRPHPPRAAGEVMALRRAS